MITRREITCPRCGAAFTCTHDALCQCVGVTLSPGARDYIRRNYPDCLCRRCLEEIAVQIPF